MTKKLIFITLKAAVIFLFILALCPINVKAEETNNSSNYEIEDYMNFDTSKADEAAGYTQGGGIKETAAQFLNGSFSFADLLDRVFSGLFSDISKQTSNIKKITALIIVCGLLKSISSSLGSKEVNDLCFFVCYSVIIYIIMTSFIEETVLVKENIQRFAKCKYSYDSCICYYKRHDRQSYISGGAFFGCNAFFICCINFFMWCFYACYNCYSWA